MTTPTTTLAEWLLVQIAEDEAVAKAVPPLDHNFDMGGVRQDERFTFGRTLPSSADGMGNWSKHRDDQSTAAHFLRHDPARVLAECAAKRDLLTEVATWRATGNSTLALSAQRVERHLATVYADREGYREEWRP